jgi:hypothetical protein
MDAEKHRRSTACGGEDEVGRMARTACVDAKANQWKLLLGTEGSRKLTPLQVFKMLYLE